jgi:hypothetical protein
LLEDGPLCFAINSQPRRAKEKAGYSESGHLVPDDAALPVAQTDQSAKLARSGG